MRRPQSASVRGRRRRDSGQAIVEAAIILPTMMFLIFGIMQITMVQHARIMTEYAAFCAARAGIVYNASVPAMTRAAELALLPTMGRTDTPAAFNTAALNTIALETAQRKPYNLPIASVTVLNPTTSSVSGITAQTLGKEVDFDDVRDAALQANILQIRLNYYYHMKIPFANQMVQTLFFAQVGNVSAIWTNPNGLEAANTMLANGIDRPAAESAFTSAGVTLTPLAGALATAARANMFYFPLQATYSMRMQSNIYVSNLGAAP